jgi:cullin 1
MSAGALAGDDTLPRAYADAFAGFSNGAKYIDRLCVFLNRYWVKRDQDEGAEAYTVYSVRPSCF